MESVKEKLRDVKSGKLTAEENISKFLEIIKKEDKKINAFIKINKNALKEAREVDKKITAGKGGKLAGLAIAVKSNINVFNLLTSCASKTLSNYYAPYDADVISAIKREDGIIIGMTNMDEFACGSSGETSFYGATGNPAAEGKIPGGSSSGSAAAVSAGFCDLALGADTGGSIRNPASHCGIVGIKPSYGRVSRYGLIDLAMSLEQIGPMTNSVYESALLLEIISGKSERDTTTHKEKVPYYEKEIQNTPKNLTLGLSKDFEKLCTDKKIYESIVNATEKLAREYGWKVKNVKLEHVD
ncbi:MAG: amidase family protein, partial [Nanoarchaeota archaeon]